MNKTEYPTRGEGFDLINGPLRVPTNKRDTPMPPVNNPRVTQKNPLNFPLDMDKKNTGKRNGY